MLLASSMDFPVVSTHSMGFPAFFLT